MRTRDIIRGRMTMMSRPELSRVMWGWCNDMQMLPSEFWDTRVPVTDDRGEHIWVISQGTLKLNFNSYLGVWIYNFEQKQSSVKHQTHITPPWRETELLVRWLWLTSDSHGSISSFAASLSCKQGNVMKKVNQTQIDREKPSQEFRLWTLVYMDFGPL